MDSRTLFALIKADGWIEVRVSGSHHHFIHPTKPGLVTTAPEKGFTDRNGKKHQETSRDLTR